MNRKSKPESGFTIIELLLAMAFIAVLMIVITLTIIQITGIYNKGLTMRSVNQSGTAISADIRQTLSGGAPFDISTAFHLLNDTSGDTTASPLDAVGGRLCTGTYSYIWNFGKAAHPVNTYLTSDKKIGFIRVRDNGAQYCAKLDSKIDDSSATDPQEFLDPTGILAMQSFAITKLANDVSIGQALYRIVFELSTNDQNALQQEQHIDSIDTSCRPPSDASAAQDYCAVNQFDFTAQAGNRGGQ